MNAPLKRVVVAVIVLFAALLVNANVIQVVEAGSLRNNPHNVRALEAQYARERGPIVVDNKAVAESVPTNDTLKYLRVYPGGPTYAPATGYFSLYNAIGIERAENEVLSGTDDRLFLRRLTDTITGRTPKGGAVQLTLDAKAQQAAWQGLQGRRGAVVALDPTTGAILALASSPSYDPSKLTTHNANADLRYYKSLVADPAQPLLDRATDRTYPPGSTFKVITTAAALSSGRYTPSSRLPAPNALTLPQTSHALTNFAGETCAGGGQITVTEALTVSCNTAYGALGLQLGAAAMQAQAQKFGFGRRFTIPMTTAASTFPDPSSVPPPQVAYSAIGQYDDAVTPLQMALVAAGIANGGVVMKPYLVAKILAPDLSTLDQTQPQQLSRAVSSAVANQLTQMMESVVAKGTGTNAQIPGVTVAGKTGTAENAPGQAPHSWFIAFAPAEQPRVAVAVIVEHGGQGAQAAAPIAKTVMQAVLGK